MYTVWKIPKLSGGFRVIESPCDSLKQQQNDNLKLDKRLFHVSPFAHAFQPYRNIVTMAMPHVRKKWVLSIDIEDYFPSITKDNFIKNVGGIDTVHFHDFGDGKGIRLSQGAPGSPFLSNVYMHDFDWRMAWKCHKYDCDYSRYADDITISGENKKDLIALYAYARGILEKYYFLKVNKKKTKYMPRWKRQLVCGVVVNERLNLPRKWRKNLRAETYQQKGGDISLQTKGKLSFANMVMGNKKQSFSSSQIILSRIISKRMQGRKNRP